MHKRELKRSNNHISVPDICTIALSELHIQLQYLDKTDNARAGEAQLSCPIAAQILSHQNSAKY